jgi:hypothetical protein
MVKPVFHMPPTGKSSAHAWVVVGDMLISVTQEGDVPMEFWDPFIADLGSPGVKRVLGLAIGSITIHAKQRRTAVVAMKDKRVAAVVGSSVARGIATALSWMGLQLRAYDWTGLTDAFDYLEPPGLSLEAFLEIVRDLLARAGAPSIEALGG